MLTDDMTRLCNEILAMRKMRGSMMSELQHGAKGLKHSCYEALRALWPRSHDHGEANQE